MDSIPKPPDELLAGGVPAQLLASTDFVMIHFGLVDLLGGSWEAAAVLARIEYRSGRDGWWTATLDEMQADMRLGPRPLRRALQELRDAGMLVSERVNRFNATQRWRIVIAGRTVNDETSFSESDVSFVSESDETSSSLCSNNVEELEEQPPTPLRAVVDAAFDRWWELYPRKQGKEAARKAYAKAARAVPHAVLFDALVVQRGALGQQQAKGGFCPHPATWLNQGRWDDDPDAICPQNQGTTSVFVGIAQRVAAGGGLDHLMGGQGVLELDS